MAVFNLKSAIITNRDAVPKVLTDSYVSGGHINESEGYVQSGSATDAATSTYKLCQVPSNARVSSLQISNGAGGGAAAVKVGVFYPSFIPLGAGLSAANAGVAISDAFFASALSVVSAASNVDITNQSGTYSIDKQELPLWSALGLSADPGISLDIVVTVTTVLAAQIFIGLKARYCE